MIVDLSIALVAAMSETGADASHRDASIDVEGAVLDARFEDIDGDGTRELLLAVRPTGTDRRELRIHSLVPGGRSASGSLSLQSERIIPVLPDVIAYGLADVREDPGREVLLFARSGVWSFSPAREGLRDNLRPLLKANLVYDVADPDALPYWDYVLDAERDLVVVPGEFTFSLWGPSRSSPTEGDYVRRVDFSKAVNAGSRDDHGPVNVNRQATITFGSSDVDMDYDDTDPRRVFLHPDRGSRHTLLSFGRSYRAPGIGDANGDGLQDLLVLGKSELWVYIAGPGGIPAEPNRIESRPRYLEDAARIDLVDVDGDGDEDIFYLATDEEGAEGFASEVFTLGVLVNDGKRMLAESPAQLLRFEALELRYEIADVTGDGAPDLVVRQFEMPSMLDVVTSLDFEYSTMIFPGTGGRRGRVFERKPILKNTRTYDEDSIQDVIAARDLTRDLSGDGIADMVEVDANGRVSIRRLEVESSFFGGKSWSLESSPWKRFESRGSIASLGVEDYNGDGIADVMSRRTDGILLLLSTGGGR